MSSIEVTSRGTALVLHSCTACGRHVWQKDGQLADRADLLDGVKTFLEQPRIPTPRRSSKRASACGPRERPAGRQLERPLAA